MSLQQRLDDIYEKGVDDDGQNLSPEEAPYFMVMEFIVCYEMEGLAEHFYRLLPDVIAGNQKLLIAFEKLGLSEVASLVEKAGRVFENYNDPEPPEFWEALLEKYDSDGVVLKIEKEIRLLDNYGIDS